MAHDALPAPLVASDADLRDFAHMQLDVSRLRDSELVTNYTPEACWAALLLWCASWHQVPAGSIPDDDRWIAKQAGYVSRGRVDDAWPEVRPGALHNWIKCSDGRLYHPVVAEKAAAAWDSKLRHHYERARDRLRKENKKRATERQPLLPELSFDAWNAKRRAAGLPMEKADASAEVPVPSGPVPGNAAGIPPETPLKGEGEGEGDFDDDDSRARGPAPAPVGAPPPQAPPAPWEGDPKDDPTVPRRRTEWAALFEERGHDLDVNSDRAVALMSRWIKAGVTAGEMRRVLLRAEERAAGPVGCWSAYADTVLTEQREIAAEIAAAPPPPPRGAAAPAPATGGRAEVLTAEQVAAAAAAEAATRPPKEHIAQQAKQTREWTEAKKRERAQAAVAPPAVPAPDGAVPA
jgi:hypothetical protein